jgi:transcriptional regulator GlxA family with amidase domain
VARVVAAAGIGRRALEKRFRARLGRTILQTIHRNRIDHAVALLTDSRLSIPEIASRCGFGNATRFNEACHRHAGATPGALRRLNRP